MCLLFLQHKGAGKRFSKAFAQVQTPAPIYTHSTSNRSTEEGGWRVAHLGLTGQSV